MNQYRLIFFDSVFNKVKYSFCCSVFWIENYLILKVQPLECEVDHPSSFEMVLNLLSSTVNNVRYFVSHYKFLVLYEIMRRNIILT